MSTFHELTCFCPKSLSENNRRPTVLISDLSNCSVAFAMYVHVYDKNRVNKIIFNILNQIQFLDSKTNIQRVKSCQSDSKQLGVFFLVNYVQEYTISNILRGKNPVNSLHFFIYICMYYQNSNMHISDIYKIDHQSINVLY